MAEQMSSALVMLTAFFSAEHIEATARRTGFVQRTAKITGRFLRVIVWCKLAPQCAYSLLHEFVTEMTTLT